MAKRVCHPPVKRSRDPAVKRFFVLMLPVTLTLGLINVNAVIDTLFASRLIDPDLAPAAINSAFCASKPAIWSMVDVLA